MTFTSFSVKKQKARRRSFDGGPWNCPWWYAMLCHDRPSNDPHGCARDGAHGRARAHHGFKNDSTNRIHVCQMVLL